MKNSFIPNQRKGFTLIELIVVIAILAVLASISAPILMTVQDNARRTSSKTVCTSIVDGVTRYAGDNNGMLPYDPEEAKADKKDQIYLVTEKSKDAQLLKILTARDDHKFNQTGDVYLKSDLQEKPMDGLYEVDDELSMYDPWGKPYYVVLCEEESGCIDPFTKKQLRGKSCLVYGLGPDSEGVAEGSDVSKPKRSGSKKTKQDKAAAASAAEAAAEAIEDNVYSWKK